MQISNALILDISVLDICGVIGSVIYVGGFFLVQIRMICGNSAPFTASKVIAALLVILSLTQNFNLASFLLQISFVIIGVYGLCNRIKHRQQRHIDVTHTRYTPPMKAHSPDFPLS